MKSSEIPAATTMIDDPMDRPARPFFHRTSTVIAAALVGIVGILYAASLLLHAMTHESTDDAFVDAHVIAIAPKIAGRILEVHVKDNQTVKKGDPIFEIDPHDAEAVVAQKQAAVDVAKAHVTNAVMAAEQAEAHVKTIAAGFEAAKANAAAASADAAKQRGDLARNRQLITGGAISQQELQHSTIDTASAEATLESKTKQLDAAAAFGEEAKKQAGSARTQVDAVRAELAEAEATLAQVKLQLADTRMTAPEDGRVTSKQVEEGGYVQVGQAVLALVPRDVWVTANFKETQITKMRPGQAVEIEVDAFATRKLHGRVDSIQAGSGARFSLLPPENATGNFVKVVQRVPVKIVFDEQPDVQQVLGPGMSAVPDVQVQSAAGPAVTVGIIAAIAIALVIIGAFLWLGRVRAFSA